MLFLLLQVLCTLRTPRCDNVNREVLAENLPFNESRSLVGRTAELHVTKLISRNFGVRMTTHALLDGIPPGFSTQLTSGGLADRCATSPLRFGNRTRKCRLLLVGMD